MKILLSYSILTKVPRTTEHIRKTIE